MPEIISNPTITTPTAEPAGSPFEPGEATTDVREFSPAELGIDTQHDETTKTDPTRQPQTQPQDQPDDVIGKALKRGRPARDLSDLDDTEKELFQNMSLEAYNKLYPFYKQFRGKDKDLADVESLKKELDSLKKNPPAQYYYDHEDAYLLQADYRDALKEAYNFNDIASHWEQQYVNARSGKPVRDLIVDQSGRPQLGGEIQPSPEIEAKIFSLMADAKQSATAAQAKLESMRTEHAGRFKSFKEQLSQAYNKMIGPYEAQLKPMMEKHLQMFPEFVRGRQEIQAIAGLYSLLQHVIASDKTNNQQQKAATINKQGAISAGPTARSITTAPKGQANLTSPEEEKQVRAMFGI